MLEKSYKSVEGGSAMSMVVVIMASLAMFFFKGDQSLTPDNMKLIIEAGLARAENVEDIVKLYAMANTPADYSKLIEMVIPLLPSTGYLAYFAKKRTELKMAALGVQNGNSTNIS